MIRVAQLNRQSLWRDEVDVIRLSGWQLWKLFVQLLQDGHNGPLFYLLVRGWRTLAGNSEFSLRYPSALLSTLAVPLGFVLARQLGFSRRASLWLSLFLTTSPYLVWYGQEAKMYALLLVLVTLAFIAYLRALAGYGARWWVVFTAATTASFYTHILTPAMLPVYVLIAFIHPTGLRRNWRGWAVSMACLTLPYLPLAAWQVPMWLQGFQSGHPFYPWPEQARILLQLYSTGLVPFAGLSFVLLFVFLLLCGLFFPEQAPGRAAPRAGRFILAVWLFLPPLVVHLISLRVPVFEDRYLIYITPAFYLLVAAGLAGLRQHARLLAAVGLGLVLAVNGIGLWQQQRQPLKADFRAAAEYLAQQHGPPSPVMIQIPYLRYTLDYYYQANYTPLEGLWTNDGKSDATVDAEMKALTANLTDLWLVVSEEELWDSRHLTRAWLDRNAELVGQAHFVRVDVYHYRFEPGAISRQALDAP